MGAIDDNDATFFNGERIGRTNGWDTPRDYAIPERLVRWGVENVLTVAVENVNAGGGPYKAPFLLLAGDARPAASAAATLPAARRPAAGVVGKPLPLRPMHVEHGVLRWPEGTEVALWGVNIYPQSWYQFENTTRLGVDKRATMKRDLDHLQQMGVEVIRIHVFDREISDGAGNLVRNEHLDLLDELVAECSRRGIYMVFTPIAWWGGPNERVGSFSYETSEPGMMFVPKARTAAQAYLRNFLRHVNRFDGRCFVDEPCLCLLEVQNKPAYFDYGDMAGEAYTPQGERSEVLARDRAELRRQWASWLAEHGFADDPALYALFRYQQMRRYVREMVGAIRGAGARQPVAISGFGGGGDEIVQAIANSECDAVTMSAYPGGWERVNDGTNLLPEMGPLTIDPRWSEKARVVYEFDTPAANVSCYLYPAIATHFRSAEAQIACQFQYELHRDRAVELRLGRALAQLALHADESRQLHRRRVRVPHAAARGEVRATEDRAACRAARVVVHAQQHALRQRGHRRARALDRRVAPGRAAALRRAGSSAPDRRGTSTTPVRASTFWSA